MLYFINYARPQLDVRFQIKIKYPKSSISFS